MNAPSNSFRVPGWGQAVLFLALLLAAFNIAIRLFFAFDTPDRLRARVPNHPDDFIEIELLSMGGFKHPYQTLQVTHVEGGGWFGDDKFTHLAWVRYESPHEPTLADITYFWRRPGELIIHTRGSADMVVSPSTKKVEWQPPTGQPDQELPPLAQ